MSYFEDRIYKQMDIRPEDNQIKIKVETMYGGEKEADMPIFSTDKEKDNIKILVYTLDRRLISYDHPNADPEHNNSYNNKEQTYYLVRNNPEAVAKGLPRYIMPKKGGIYPFLPPQLVEKWERREQITTLVLTEGYFKAFYAARHGWDIVGFSSITHYADSKTRAIHRDVQRIILDCKVKNVVMLYDGDCLNINTADIEAKVDLAKRPNVFLNSMLHIRELLTDFNVNIYFSHVLSDNVPPNHPKGLDDLLIDQKGKEAEILSDLMNLSTPGSYFYRLNTSLFAKKLQGYFNLKSADQFFGAWSDIIKDREFVYFGSTYKVNGDGKLERTVPKELKNFIRVGDEYYEMIKTPNIVTGDLDDKLVQRKKGTISDDFGQKAFANIPKFKAFINMPSNTNYQRIISNCYNIYNPFEYEPEAGDWSNIEMFIHHIFGEQFELGLDYLQILYQHPTQPLPILCLVSRERKTGKTTFIDFLKDLYKENAIKIGNAEFQSKFNAFLTTKLIVAVDESNLAKNQDVTERIKMLSTSNKVISEGKGTNQVEMDHFAKYILCSNFETNFIYTQEEETRFWVRKVPVLTNEVTDLLMKMHEEIPAFLYFMNNRKISTPHTTRTWFDEDLLKTDALRRLKDEQRPRAIKMIENFVREMAFDFKMKEITINDAQLLERIPGLKKYESSLKRHITQDMKSDITRTKEGTANPQRYSLPRYLMTLEGGNPEIVWDKFFNRAYVFKAEDYLTKAEFETNFPTDTPPSEGEEEKQQTLPF